LTTTQWQTTHPNGRFRVIVTKPLPGQRWLDTLSTADCRVDICQSDQILTTAEIKAAFQAPCHGAIGQLTESWNDDLFAALKAAGGKVYSNYAVGYNNVDVPAATRHAIAVGNTPGVLTDTTAEMTVALTLAAARRVVEADSFMRAGKYQGWLPTLFLGQLLQGGTVGVIGAGRIGSAYARMMVEGFKMNLIYFNPHQNKALEDFVAAYSDFLQSQGEQPLTCTRVESVEVLLKTADIVSLHPVLDETTHHLINADRLKLMKEDAILVNASRGPVIDEAALVAHCRENPNFRASLDVFEAEPEMAPGLSELHNVVIVPHIASATRWTREGMATLAAANVAGILYGWPVWGEGKDIRPFLSDNPPQAAPSIVNSAELNLD
jgi:hydroxypyruvate reductase 1